jgi:Ca2+-binding RTX toxin-like protein
VSNIFPATTVKTDDSDALDINSGDYVYVGAEVQLLAEGLGDGISATGYAWIDVHGSVVGEIGISVAGDPDDMTSISVAAGADVSGTIYGAMDVGGLHQISNFGAVESTSPIESGIYVYGAGSINNYGTISAYAAILDQDNTATDHSSLYNDGTISGNRYSFVSGSEFGGAVDDDSESIVNAGAMVGAIAMSNGGDKIRNTGSIDGAIHFGSGTNTFNGVGGAVDGEIYGGSGADAIHAGNDGEIINGRGGHDRLYGGGGADVFAFTSSGTANWDHIYNFNIADDLIQLNHLDFIKLAAGATPAFSIATKATSANDHLFYNSGDGGLWYDPDGNGSKAAREIANLGTGLKLTAADFKVV